jgi:hypothetical protein
MHSIPEASTLSFFEDNDALIDVSLVWDDPSAGLSQSEMPTFEFPPVQPTPCLSRAGSFCHAHAAAQCTAMNQKFSDNVISALELVLEDEAHKQPPQSIEGGIFKAVAAIAEGLRSLWLCSATAHTNCYDEEIEGWELDSMQSSNEQHEDHLNIDDPLEEFALPSFDSELKLGKMSTSLQFLREDFSLLM